MNTQPNQFINGPHPISPSVRGRTKRRVRSRRHYTRRDANMWQAFVALVQLLKLLDHLAWFLGRGMLAGTLWTILACWKLALRCLGVDVDRAARRREDKSARGLDPVSLATTEVPERIVLSSRGDPQKLRAKMRGWMKWRAEYHIETILHSPKPSFELVKAFYPHALHGRTRRGHAIQMEAPGQFSTLIKALKSRGFADPTRAVVEHVSFVMSYTFANVDPRSLPNGRILRIIDMSRMDINDTTYEAFIFLKAMAGAVSIAFPERVHRVVIVNPPSGFGVLWSIFSPLASPSTLARVKVCRSIEESRSVLGEDMDIGDIPREYGGQCNCGGGGGNRLRRFGKYGECPSAAMSGCWRDSALERQLWRDADVLNGGEGDDAGESSGHHESRGRLNTHSKSGSSGHHDSSLHARKQRRASSGLKSGRKGAEGAVAAHERRRRKAVEKGESSTPSSSWFW